MADNSTTSPLLGLGKLQSVLSLVLDRVDPEARGLEYRWSGPPPRCSRASGFLPATWTFW